MTPAYNFLIVEDEVRIRNLLSAAITINPSFSGSKVHQASDGLEAKTFLETLAPDSSIDMVITDGNMPHMEGPELIRYIRSNPRYEALPVILMSGKMEESEAIAAGASAYISKPFHPLDMFGLIETQLKK